MWENHLFGKFTLINESLGFSALGLHLSDVCERVGRRTQVWRSLSMSGGPGWFPQHTVLAGTSGWSQLCTSALNLSKDHQALWYPTKYCKFLRLLVKKVQRGPGNLCFSKPSGLLIRQACKKTDIMHAKEHTEGEGWKRGSPYTLNTRNNSWVLAIFVDRGKPWKFYEKWSSQICSL